MTDTTTNTDTNANTDSEMGMRAALDRLRVADSDGPRRFDARLAHARDNVEEAREKNLSRLRSARPAALDDARELAALYYGGHDAAPEGLTQAEIGDLLGVSAPAVSRAMSSLGIYPPNRVRYRRATAARAESVGYQLPTDDADGGGR